MIKHHLTDKILMAYSAGQLSEAFNLIVATHISMCDECRAAMSSFDALGGALLEDECLNGEPAPDLQATMALIKAESPPDRTLPPVQSTETPFPLVAYVGDNLDDVKWKPVGMGVKQSILQTSAEATARLLYIPAGVAVPDHGHHGTELTLVLRGAYSDETDHFTRGDVEIAGEDLHHTPIADAHSDCICLAVTDAPLKFSGVLPRILQPLLRI
ncbi:ChrR family anti-sigma-E factor [Paracoccaceae bacterium]|nr:ChrR family anti-sigma-E factor [Paracoccaceae bacterium]